MRVALYVIILFLRQITQELEAMPLGWGVLFSLASGGWLLADYRAKIKHDNSL